MSIKRRFWVLLLGSVLILAAVLFAVYQHIIPLLPAFTAILLSVIKKIGTLAFWKKAPVFLGKWSLRTVYKLFLRGIVTVVAAILIMALFRRDTRRRVKARVRLLQVQFTARFESLFTWFDQFFGFKGAISFILSACIAVGMLILTFIYFDGFAFFVWIGSWGPLAPVWAAISDFVVHRVPFLTRMSHWVSTVWKMHIAKHLPGLLPWVRAKFLRSLRHAKRVQRLNVEQRTRLWKRLQRRKARRAWKRRMRREKTFVRLMWIAGTVPRWERIGFTSDEYTRIIDRAMHDSSERLYIDGMLAGKIRPTYLEGGDVSWRNFRR